jgi:hypothetical protein
MMICSYMDESFDKGHEGVYAVGGILARGVAIFELERKWEKLRRRSDIDIEFFKASECERGFGQFSKVCATPKSPTTAEKAKLESISKEFLGLIADVAPYDGQRYICIQGVGVVQAEFYDVIADPHAKAVLGPSPFRLAHDFALVQCAWAMKQLGPVYSVSFVCDEDQEHRNVVEVAYAELKAANPIAAVYMNTFSTADEKKCEPLQAADAAVYEVRRALNGSLKHWYDPLRGQFSVLADARAMFLITHTTRAQLEHIVATHSPGEPFKLDALMEAQLPEENIQLNI